MTAQKDYMELPCKYCRKLKVLEELCKENPENYLEVCNSCQQGGLYMLEKAIDLTP